MGPFESVVEKQFDERAVNTPEFPRMLSRYVAETEGIPMNEAARRSLSRVFRLFTDPARNAAIITAFRGEYPYQTNLVRNRALMADLRAKGFGFVPVIGGWIEDVADGTTRPVEEESLVVSGPIVEDVAPMPEVSTAFSNVMYAMLRKYDQDGVLLKLSGSTDALILNKNGSTFSLGPWRLNMAAKYYTKMRLGAQAGRKMEFQFEHAGDDSVSTRQAVHAYFRNKA